MPQAVHEVLPGMGHMGPITHADAVSARIERFLHACEAPERSTLTRATRR